jgi:tetratricopeptide (TPR) repeat protein
MDHAATPPADLLVLKVLPTVVHCREIGGGLITYRKKLSNVVAGQRLTVSVERKWKWRHTEMIGGELLFADFSLRAIQQAGYARTECRAGRLVSHGDDDARLREALLLPTDEWAIARAILLDVLEAAPGNLLAHAALGDIHRRIAYFEAACAHYTAAIRLGLGALVHEENLPVDPRDETGRALLGSLVGRAVILIASGREDAAAADLRRALAWDPTDFVEAGPVLAKLLERMPPSDESRPPAQALG